MEKAVGGGRVRGQKEEGFWLFLAALESLVWDGNGGISLWGKP